MMVGVEDILSQIPFGKMQYYIILFHFWMFSTTAFLCYNYCFFLLDPMYRCSYTSEYANVHGIPGQTVGNLTTYEGSCTREEVCSGEPALLKWAVDWTSSYSLENWFVLLDIHCASSFEVGLFGSLYFAGFLLSSALIPPFADKYGRKFFVIIVCVVQTIGFGLMILIPNLTLYYVLNFILGASVTCKAMVAYTHLMEWIPGKEGHISGLIFGFDGLMFVICPPILVYITRNT